LIRPSGLLGDERVVEDRRDAEEVQNSRMDGWIEWEAQEKVAQ